MANDILKYTSKDFDSIKTDLIDSISSLTDTWTSREDGDPGIVLVKHMSAIGDMLSYNLDKQALECYGPTVTQRKNAAKLFELVGYKMHWYRSAVTTVTMTYMPKVSSYISMCLAAVNADGDTSLIQDAYFNYRSRYYQNGDIVYGALILPPPSENPPSYFSDYFSEQGISPTIDITQETYLTPNDVPPDHSFSEIRESEAFSNNANKFLELSNMIIEIYQDQKENQLGIHTYIEDQDSQLGIYPNNYGNLAYSLIPSINPKIDNNGNYEPSFNLIPFVPSNAKAIQGTMNMVNFDVSNLQNNRFYLPDFEIDEDNIFVLFNTDFDNPNPITHPSIIIEKTDNILTEERIQNDNPSSPEFFDGHNLDSLKVYFQFRIDDFDYPYIELSSYWNSVLPDTGKFRVYYFKTRGKYGNITKNFLKRLGTYNASNIVVENVDTNISQYDNGYMLSRPGFNPETAREAYVNSLNFVMTFDSLVTFYDFERFTKRISGITNALAVDRQRMRDLNLKLKNECDSYTEDQLRSILGNRSNNLSEQEMRIALYNIRKVSNKRSQLDNYTPDPPVLVNEALNDSTSIDSGDFKAYTLNMYPIYGDFLSSQDNGNTIAKRIMYKADGAKLPYILYKIIDNTDSDSEYHDDVWKAINDYGFQRVHIVSVDPKPTFARLFEWKCCGTLHLTKSVSQEEARSIIKKVVQNLKETFCSENLTFGNKIKQMDVIQVVSESDSRIRYFDAGIGDKNVIVYSNPVANESNYFNVDSYFNPESLMVYSQNESGEDLLRVDQSYIYTDRS